MINKNNFFILTGGPGAGKTSVLEELRTYHCQVVSEGARLIIQQQQALGGHATHSSNRLAFCRLMLGQAIIDYKRSSMLSEPTFFDRGIPDVYCYAKAFCSTFDESLLEAVNQYRYNLTVFLFPPWLDIYCHDAERKQDFKEAIATYEAIKESYLTCGYQLIDVPKGSIKERANFILGYLKTIT